MMMRPTHPADRPGARRASRWRAHGVVTTVLLVMLGVMIVRDLISRRWGSPAPPSSDVTQRSL